MANSSDIDHQLSKFLNNFTSPDFFSSPPDLSPSPSHRTTFSPALIAVLCFLAAIFLLVSYYALVARFIDSRRRHRQNRVWDEHRHVVAHGEAAADMAGDEVPIFWPEFGRRGLSKEEIERLPAVEYRKSLMGGSTGSAVAAKDLAQGIIDIDGAERVNYCGESTTTTTDDCAVCLSGFEEGEMVRVLPRCNHGFHFSCIHSWLQFHPNCPLCRTDVLLSSSSDPSKIINPSSDDHDPSSFTSIDIEAGVDGSTTASTTVPQDPALSSSNSHRRRQLHIIDELAQSEEEDGDGEALKQRMRPLRREQKTTRGTGGGGAGAGGLPANRSFHEVASVRRRMLHLLDEFEASSEKSKLHDVVVEPMKLEEGYFRCYSTGRRLSMFPFSDHHNIIERPAPHVVDIAGSNSLLFRLGHGSHSRSDTHLAIGADPDQRQLPQEDSAETARIDINDLLQLAMVSSSSNSTSTSLAHPSSSSSKISNPLGSSSTSILLWPLAPTANKSSSSCRREGDPKDNSTRKDKSRSVDYSSCHGDGNKGYAEEEEEGHSQRMANSQRGAWTARRTFSGGRLFGFTQ